MLGVPKETLGEATVPKLGVPKIEPFDAVPKLGAGAPKTEDGTELTAAVAVTGKIFDGAAGVPTKLDVVVDFGVVAAGCTVVFAGAAGVITGCGAGLVGVTDAGTTGASIFDGAKDGVTTFPFSTFFGVETFGGANEIVLVLDKLSTGADAVGN